ncbi:hypothetical protein ES706_01198 [subsurface metagenome]|nr:HEAT repeat domain-containing protein [Hadesarchaea archaeon]
MSLFGLFKPNVEKLKAKKDVEGLIKALMHENLDLRWKAARALGEIGDKRAVQPLIQGLKDVNDYVRDHAGRALGKIGEPALEPLIQLLKVEEDTKVTYHVEMALLNILEKIGELAVEPLIQALKDENKNVRHVVVGVFRRFAGAKTEMAVELLPVEPFIQALKDEEVHVRLNAAGILGDMDNKRAVKPLIGALMDQHSRVRQLAAWALGKIGDKRAIEPLERAEKAEFGKDRGAHGGMISARIKLQGKRW